MTNGPSQHGEMPTGAGTSAFVNIGGLRFHYVSWGPADAPVLLCLHGLRSYGRTFEPLAAALADSFRVLALDQRGRGQTDWDPARRYHATQYAHDIAGFVDALEIDRFSLLGHSMGGINALVFSRTHGQRLHKLVLEDSGPGASRGSKGAVRINEELQRTPVSFPDWSSARNFWRSIRPDVTAQAIESRLVNSMRETSEGIVWIHDQAGITECRLRPSQPDPDLWPCVERLSCPTLLVRGARSDYLGRDIYHQMLRENPLIRGVEIEGAGHYVHDDQPGAFCTAVETFMRSQE